MLVEIPDPEVILGLVVAFLVGLGGLYGYYKVRPFINKRADVSGPSQSERLEYYERQLIDMKIRLDALEVQGVEEKAADPNLELRQFLERLVKNAPAEQEEVVVKEPKPRKEPAPTPKTSPIPHSSPTDFVLHLITDKAMTSRDIQVTLKKSREHTSRLMKKLFEDGYVQRNTESKPYTYSITEKGRMKIGEILASPQTA